MADWITVETDIAAPVERVWDCYNQPEHVTGWNFASPDWHCPRARSDLRVGGQFSSRMEARDGSFGFDFEGTYTRIEPHALIAYDFGDRKAEVRFTPQDARTRVSVGFQPETENDPEMQRAGWQAILDNFARYVEGSSA